MVEPFIYLFIASLKLDKVAPEVFYFFVCKAVVGLAAGGDALFFFAGPFVFGVEGTWPSLI